MTYGVKGGQAVVVIGRLVLGRDTDVGSRGGMDGEGGRYGWSGDGDRLNRW